MSVWTSIEGVGDHFPHWPNPFTCGIKSQTSWQCGNYVVIDVELVAGCLAHFFFSNFVPSFQEITRKFVGGSYRCGFYGLRGTKSPLDVFWKSSTPGRIAGEILSPLAKGAFYWWAAETTLDAVSLWQSLMYAEDAGKSTPYSMLIPEGHAQIRFASSTGGINFPEALCSFDLFRPHPSTIVESAVSGPWESHMYGVLDARGSDHINLHGELFLQAGGEVIDSFDLTDVRLGDVVPWELKGTSQFSSQILRHQFWWTQDVVSPLFPSEVIGNRWLVKQLVNP